MLDFLTKNWEWLIAGIAGIFGLGVAKSNLVTKSELYNKDGSLIYVRTGNCSDDMKEIKDILIENRGKDDQRDKTITDVRLFLAELKGAKEAHKE